MSLQLMMPTDRTCWLRHNIIEWIKGGDIRIYNTHVQLDYPSISTCYIYTSLDCFAMVVPERNLRWWRLRVVIIHVPLQQRSSQFYPPLSSSNFTSRFSCYSLVSDCTTTVYNPTEVKLDIISLFTYFHMFSIC